MEGKFDAYIVNFGPKGLKLISRPVYCLQLYGILRVIRMLTSSKSLLILGSFLIGLALAQDEQNSGYKLIQAKPENDRDRELLKEMDKFYPEDVVDFWSDPKEDTVEFLVQGRPFVLFVCFNGPQIL